MLTACSSAPQGPRVTVAPTIKRVHPELPPPVRLADEKWTPCENGTRYCQTPAQVQRVIRNKTQVGQWMSRASNILCYYRADTTEQANACLSN